MTKGYPARGVPDAGLRVALALPGDEQVAAIGDWFAEAWLDVYGRPVERPGLTAPNAASWLADPGPRLESRLIVVGGEPVGFIVLQAEHVDAAGCHLLTIAALAIAPAYRNLGLGAEAVYAAETRFRPALASQALVPIGNSLALYFWLRAGYHPLFAAGHGRAGFTVMERRSSLSPGGAVAFAGR